MLMDTLGEPAYRDTMSPCRISLRIVGISIVAMFSACAPDLTVAPGTSSSSSGGTGGDGGASASSSSSSSASSSSSSASSSSGLLGANGTPCQTHGQCASGVCQDGVCCDTLCGTCHQCDAPDSMGTCTPIGVGKDDCATPGELCNGANLCECGVALPTTGTSCPPPWVDGPNPGMCILSCSSQDACKDMTVTCPAGFGCFVNCSGSGSCSGNTVIQCPEKHHCALNCIGKDACKGANVQVQCSSDGPCRIECANATGACGYGPKLICGDNACAAICSGTNKPTIVANNSCSPTGC